MALLAITALAAFLRLYQIDQIPPGDGYDPAFYGLDALDILDGARPVFLETNFGREVMFSYLVAASFTVLGPGTTAIHVASAIVGILTVPAVYLVAREVFATDDDVPTQVGALLAALTIAVSYSHLSWSRYGVRAILVPLLAAVTVYFLWRGLRVKKVWMFIAYGVCLGLSLYTYQAARMLLPLVLLGHVIWFRRRNRRRWLLELALAAGATLVVFAPMGWYALNHPGSLMQRANQVAVWDAAPGERLSALVAQLADTVSTFSVRGDRQPYNLPGRPALNPFLSLAFYAGIAISLWRIRKPAYLFLLAWLCLMCTPAVLAQGGPITKRMIGAWPAVAMLIVVGLLVPFRRIRGWLEQHSDAARQALGAVALVAVGAGFVYTGAITYRDYFLTWAQDPHLFYHFEAGLSAIGDYVGELPAAEQVFVSPAPPDHPSIILHSNRREDVKGYNGRVCLALPSSTASGTTYVIVPQDDKNSLPALETVFPEGGIVAEGPLYFGRPYFLAYRVAGATEPLVTPTQSLDVIWSDQIVLEGYDLDAASYSAGDSIRLTLYYRGVNPPDGDYTAFVHLLGPPNPATGSPVWGQLDAEPCAYSCPTSGWERGDFLIDHLNIAIAEDAPPGVYELVTGFYRWPTLERVPVSHTGRQVAAHDVVTLDRIHVTGP